MIEFLEAHGDAEHARSWTEQAREILERAPDVIVAKHRDRVEKKAEGDGLD